MLPSALSAAKAAPEATTQLTSTSSSCTALQSPPQSWEGARGSEGGEGGRGRGRKTVEGGSLGLNSSHYFSLKHTYLFQEMIRSGEYFSWLVSKSTGSRNSWF